MATRELAEALGVAPPLTRLGRFGPEPTTPGLRWFLAWLLTGDRWP